MKSVILDRKETEDIVLKMARTEIGQRNPQLSARARDKLAKKLARKALRSFPGKTMRIDLKPQNWLEALKEKYLPATLRSVWPVRYH